MIEILEQDFDVNVIIQNLRKKDTGAIVSFIGCVRDFSEREDAEGKKIRVNVEKLIYESYEEMAIKKLAEIRDFALSHYEINDMDIVHRIGTLKPTDNIVMIAVSAAHRKDAFRACEYAIKKLKKNVPIWKKEVSAEKEYWVGEEDDQNG